MKTDLIKDTKRCWQFCSNYRKGCYIFTIIWMIVGFIGCGTGSIIMFVKMNVGHIGNMQGLLVGAILLLAYGGLMILMCIHIAHLMAWKGYIKAEHVLYSIWLSAFIPGLLLIGCINENKEISRTLRMLDAADTFFNLWKPHKSSSDKATALEEALLYRELGGNLKDLGFKKVKGQWKAPAFPKTTYVDVQKMFDEKISDAEDDARWGSYRATGDVRSLL